MESNYKYLYLVVFLLPNLALFAQGLTISGKVTDSQGLEMPGVNVVVQGTTRGTLTDFDGNYSIEAELGEVLVFTYIGYNNHTETITENDQINVVLTQDTESLDEVIITAQGIPRAKKALGYAVTTVDVDQVEAKPNSDIGRALSGKVAGVDITATSGIAGGGTSILIRDKSSITGSNQPLFVVDGVPFDSATNTLNSFASDAASANASSRFLDLDPNNIAEISILKGLSATVLYGEAGSNGVVLITTKSGRSGLINRKFEVSLSQTTFLTKIANLPDYQNLYGGGADLNYSNAYVGNWGPRFDPSVLVQHMYDQPHITPFFPEYAGLQVPYVPIENNVRDFFRTGISNSTSVNMAGSSEKATINLNVGRTLEEGYIPENNVKRLNLSLGGNAKLANNIDFGGTFNFTHTEYQTPPAGAANANLNLLERLLFIPRNYDINNLPYQNPVDGSSIYYRTDIENPRWIVDNARYSSDTRRFFGSLYGKYTLTDYLNFTYRFGLDTYNEFQQYYVNKGGQTTNTDALGFLRRTNGTNTIYDHSFIFNVDNISFTEKLGFNAQFGFNSRRDAYEQNGVANIEQIVFGFIDGSNFKTQTNSDPFGATLETRAFQNVIGLYGQLLFDYGNYLFLTLSGRNDWASTVEMENRSLFYPSASISFVPTSAFEDLGGDRVNFLKLRASYGTSANFPAPYSTRPTLVLGTQAFAPPGETPIDINSSANLFANPNLKPELLREFEVGIESRLFNNRFGFEVSAYQRNAEDQILQKPLDNSTGYLATFINAGEIETQGLELAVDLIPIQTEDFIWNLNSNFTAYESTVLSLPNPDDQIAFAGFTRPGNYAIVGEPLGVIVGDYALRDANGNFLIDETNGLIIRASSLGLPSEIIGDPNPDWKLNTNTNFAYKGWTLAAQVEYTHGGDIWSQTAANLLRRGVTTYNVDRRDELIILPGTLANPSTGEPILDASGNPIPNNFAITQNDTYFLNMVDADAESIYDGSHIRLREVSLSYEFPEKLLNGTALGSLSLSAIGQNLYFNAFNFPEGTNIDPETSGTGVGNGRGLDFQLAPSSKRYGFSVRATF